MGKRKDTTGLPRRVKAGKVAPKKQKSMTIWEELYSDLAPNIAEALRTARVKPDQLTNMTDGDIMAINGVSENGLEEIRTKYQPDIATPVAESTAQNEEGLPAEVSLSETKEGPRPANKRHDFRGGRAIKTSKSKVDPQKKYELKEAVKLLKSTNITKFVSTVTLHLNLVTKDTPTRVELTFPFVAGATKRVAIVTDELIKDIEKGKLEFDILVTSPAFMPKLAKYAKVLGPKGLMPSPKAGTVTSDPEKKAKEFAGGKTVVKAEAKFPLMHVTVGKIDQKEEELIANIQALLDGVKLKNVTKATLASTMSPGIKLQLN